MRENPNAAYIYDGSYEGLLCCVFRCYEDKFIPSAITTQNTLLEQRHVSTDRSRAARVTNGIVRCMGRAAERMIKTAFLSDFEDKGVAVARYIVYGMKKGSNVLGDYSQPCVARMHEITRAVSKEKHRCLEFLKFSIVNSTMVAVVSPTHNVLPMIAGHFAQRFPNEKFFIYDNVHKLGLAYSCGKCSLAPVENFEMDEFDEEEEKYIELWKLFYKTIEIPERHNEKCRLNHMPKRYWFF